MNSRAVSPARRGIQSIEVGFALVEALGRAGRKLPLKQLAQDAGMPPSKAHLYLVSFMRVGLVTQDRVSGHYGLGSTAIRLGMAAIDQLNILDVAADHLAALQQIFELTFSIAVWGNFGPTIIYKLDGRHRTPFAIKVGFVLPILTTATGAIFHAFLPESQWRDLVDIEDRESPGAAAAAQARLPAVRASRIAITEGKLQIGFSGVSTPIFGADGIIQASVTALGVSSVENPADNRALQTALLDAGEQISLTFGCPGRVFATD